MVGRSQPMSFLPLIRIWLWLSALATLAGWLLSALGQLNRLGYLAFGAVAVVSLWLSRNAFGGQRAGSGFNWQKTRRRFRRWLPACFALLACLIFLGGALYPPTTHTAMTYRTPRVLHWLAEGHWHWIHTPNYRMNNRACGFEWLTAPLLLFTRSDRSLFLINFFPFLLLPGLIFSVCTRLGVRPKVAWHWMWLLPTGYNFLLQAGSVANDTFPTVYALAALDFGLRAWASRRPADLWLSLLAAALLTGAKASNLPLLLPWVVVAFPLLPLLIRRPAATLALVLLAAVVSFLPTAALNACYCGDWSGLKFEHVGMEMKNPIVGIWGNSLLMLKNFVPPFFPLAGWWNQSALSVLPPALVAPMVANFEGGFHKIGEMPIEDATGIGFGLSLLILVSVLAGLRRGRTMQPAGLLRCMLFSPWVSLLAYCVKSGMNDAARLISPYYALLLPSLLIGARQAGIIRRRWWRGMVWGVLVLAFIVVVTIPGRPLWPARTILSRLLALKPGQRLVARALNVYTVYGQRSDPLANVRALLPPGLTTVGFMGDSDDIDISLWRPFFARRVEHILLTDTAAQIRQRHIQYAVVNGGNLAANGATLADWLQRVRAEPVAAATATVTVTLGPQTWYIVRFP